MRFLLDTCILLWALEDNRVKLKKFLPILEDPSKPVFVSVVSYWEIVIKQSLGKLELPDDLIGAVEEAGFRWVSLELHHISTLKNLPPIHNDPFDRLLIAQAQTDQFTLLTTDQYILQYNIALSF